MRSTSSDIASAIAGITGKQFLHDLSPRAMAIVMQLPLTTTLALVVVIAWSSHPDLLMRPLFLLGLGLHTLLFTMAAMMPWRRMRPVAYMWMHALAFIPIWTVHQAAIDTDIGTELLAVIPSIWLAGSQRYPRAGLALSFVGPLLMVWTPLVFTGAASVENLASVLMLPIIALAVGTVIGLLGASMRHQQRLREQARLSLSAALEASGQKERMLNALVEAVNIGVVALDGSGRTRLANERHRRIEALANTGSSPLVDPGEWVMYAPTGEPLSSEANPFRRAARGEEFSDDVVLLGTGERRRSYWASARAIRNHGRQDGAVVTLTDVTDLVNAMKAKDAFLSSVTHELRTPLTSIIGYVDLLLEQDGLPPRAARDLEVINRNAERLNRLVTDLLSAGSGEGEIRPEPADLAEVIRLSMATVAPHAANAGVELFTEVDGPLPAMIDTVRIAQVLDNLLSNAVKYSPGGGAVTVRTREDADVVICEVEDTGMGISPADSGALFTEFFRSDEARRASIPGVGLGLAIARRIVENHGGSISCTSVLGQGSTFRILLPKAQLQTHR